MGGQTTRRADPSVVEDAAHYFNQFGYDATEELWKCTFIVGAKEGDVDALGQAFQPGELVFVSEERLGFGLDLLPRAIWPNDSATQSFMDSRRV